VGRFVFYRHESAGEIEAYLGYYVSGVTLTGHRRIHATKEAQDHELVHAVATRLGNPGAFFHEGLAVRLGNRGRWNGRDVGEIARRYAAAYPFPSLVSAFDPRQTAEDRAQAGPSTAADLYAVAGSFMGFLEKHHGYPKIAAFFRASPTPARAAAAFQEVFGTSIEAEGAAWARAVTR
jgi:hypothetical protein